jgi:hypothetical protein
LFLPDLKIGDLVIFSPHLPIPGALTAVKYFERLRKKIGDNPGVIVSQSGDNFCVAFGEMTMVIHRQFLKLVE